jgi:hypothetical protein
MLSGGQLISTCRPLWKDEFSVILRGFPVWNSTSSYVEKSSTRGHVLDKFRYRTNGFDRISLVRLERLSGPSVPLNVQDWNQLAAGVKVIRLQVKQVGAAIGYS